MLAVPLDINVRKYYNSSNLLLITCYLQLNIIGKRMLFHPSFLNPGNCGFVNSIYYTPREFCTTQKKFTQEQRYSTKSIKDTVALKAARLFLNVITFGCMGRCQNRAFRKALLADNLARAENIYSAGWIKNVGANVCKKLSIVSLAWLANKEIESKTVWPMATAAICRLTTADDIDSFLNNLPQQAKEKLALSRFRHDWNDVAVNKTLVKHGLNVKTAVTPNNLQKILFPIYHFNLDEKKRELLQFLLEQGVDPNIEVVKDYSVTLLLQIMKSSKRVNNHLREARFASTKEQNDTKEAMELLLKHGANPNIASRQGELPLSVAATKGYDDVVKLLLDYKANPNLASASKYTPFEEALMSRHVNPTAVRLLHDRGGITSQPILNQALEKVVCNYSNGESLMLSQPTETLEKLSLLKSYGAVAPREVLTQAFDLCIKLQLPEHAKFFKECGADTSKFDTFVSKMR